MTTIAIHQVRTVKGAPPEPVGIWLITDDDGDAFYPEPQARYEKRARAALLKRPMPLEPWVRFKASISTSFRLHNLSGHDTFFSIGAASIIDLPQILEIEREKWATQVRLAENFHVATRTAAANDSDEPPHDTGLNRFALAQSWWLASELVRRHPELVAYEMHPGGGQYDVICVAVPRELGHCGVAPRIMLNRVGTIQVHMGEHTEVVATWLEVLESSSAHVILHKLEKSAFLKHPVSGQHSTARAITYRFFATALNLLVNDRHKWDVRSEFFDAPVYGEGLRGYVRDFPAAIESLRVTPNLGLPGEPESHYWALKRDDETVLIASMEGLLFRRTGEPIDLMQAYKKSGRRITPMTVSLLTKWL